MYITWREGSSPPTICWPVCTILFSTSVQGAVPLPGSDAACQYALDGAVVEHPEHAGADFEFLQQLKAVQAFLIKICGKTRCRLIMAIQRKLLNSNRSAGRESTRPHSQHFLIKNTCIWPKYIYVLNLEIILNRMSPTITFYNACMIKSQDVSLTDLIVFRFLGIKMHHFRRREKQVMMKKTIRLVTGRTKIKY